MSQAKHSQQSANFVGQCVPTGTEERRAWYRDGVSWLNLIKRCGSMPDEGEATKETQTEKPVTDWRARAAELAQQAQDLLATGSLESSMACVDSAFAIIEAEGSEEDVVFTFVLLVAADQSLAIEEYESAGALYKRSSGVAQALIDGAPRGPEGETLAVLARSYLGMARADVGRKYNERAKERYQTALQFMKECVPAFPAEVLDQVRDEIFSLA